MARGPELANEAAGKALAGSGQPSNRTTSRACGFKTHRPLPKLALPNGLVGQLYRVGVATTARNTGQIWFVSGACKR